MTVAAPSNAVISLEDIELAFPDFIRESDSAEVRDALYAALLQIFLEDQDAADYAASQADILSATGTYLEGLAKDRGFLKHEGEGDESLRARTIGIPDLVTPAAIMAAVNALLAPHTAVLAQYSEAVQDRWFVRRAPPADSFHSYVWGTTTSRAPTYPDRLYSDDSVANGGYVRPQSSPGGARVFKDAFGRMFVLRIPDLSGLDSQIAGVFATGGASGGFYVGSGTASLNTTFIRSKPQTAISLYTTIANTVTRLLAHSIRWVMWVDPKLK